MNMHWLAAMYRAGWRIRLIVRSCKASSFVSGGHRFLLPLWRAGLVVAHPDGYPMFRDSLRCKILAGPSDPLSEARLRGAVQRYKERMLELHRMLAVYLRDNPE